MSCVHRFYGPGKRRWLRDNPVIAAVGGGTLFVLITVLVIMVAWKRADSPAWATPKTAAAPDRTQTLPPPGN
jgi:hypothetical protein